VSVADRLRRGFAAFSAGDLAALDGLFADDVVWTIPGETRVSGTYRGRDEILAMLRSLHELTGGSYRVEPLWLVADDEHAAVAYRATGEREGRSIDLVQVLACTVRDGRLAEVLALPADPAAFAAFWA
jgi:ketosteroid isomerase-like protein